MAHEFSDDDKYDALAALQNWFMSQQIDPPYAAWLSVTFAGYLAGQCADDKSELKKSVDILLKTFIDSVCRSYNHTHNTGNQ